MTVRAAFSDRVQAQPKQQIIAARFASRGQALACAESPFSVFDVDVVDTSALARVTSYSSTPRRITSELGKVLSSARFRPAPLGNAWSCDPAQRSGRRGCQLP